MGKRTGQWSRRDFLRSTASVALIPAAGLLNENGSKRSKAPEPASDTVPAGDAPAQIRARVVLVRDKEVLDGSGKPRPHILARMLNDGVTALLDAEDAGEAWASLVQPKETVGVKSNEWGPLRTPPELEAIIRERLVRAGVPDDRIAIADRGARRSDIFAEATALINVRPMRTHHWSGVGGCIKNYINFDPEPSRWHGDACADLAGVWDLPLPRGKTRLNILVMLTPLFHGKGPHHFHPRYTWDYHGLIIGTDPVAVDATGLRILQAKRKEHFGEDQPLVVSPKHIRVADEKHRLGVADPDRIRIIRLGSMEQALI